MNINTLPKPPLPHVVAPVPPRLAKRPMPTLGRGPALGQTFDQMLSLGPEAGDIIRLIFHGATSYLGVHVGMNEKGLLSGLGWFLGIGQGIGAALDVYSLIERAVSSNQAVVQEPATPVTSIGPENIQVQP